MKLGSVFITGVLAAGATASWLSSAAYNKWHETELERWLSDHNVPYPAASTRHDLEALVRDNWHDNVVAPYQGWDAAQLRAYLQTKGQQAKDTQEGLVNQVKGSWYETEDKSQNAWGDVKEWIFDTWTDSQLKSFCDKSGISVPQPRTRDVMISKIRANYESAAKKAGETAAYPGDWLYASWSDSDLKSWLDKYGFDVPQTGKRDQLVAAVRRNSRLAWLKEREATDTASETAKSAWAGLSESMIDTWSESQLKEFCDKNGITVPQGTKLDELRALVRRQRAHALGDDAAGKLGAATTSAGNQFAKATDSAALMYEEAFNKATATWSHSRLKSFLDARGIPVPQNSEVDELRALVRKHAHVAAGGWTFEDWSVSNLKDFVLQHGDAAAKNIANKASATRAEMVGAARSAYASAVATGGESYDAASNYITKTGEDAKNNAFETWSESELKSYLDSYGIPVYQTSTVDSLRAEARKQYTYWKYGTSTPGGTLAAKVSESIWGTIGWLADLVGQGSQAAQDAAKNMRQEL